MKNRPAGSYILFAAGPRGRVGFNLILAEAEAMFLELICRYKFSNYSYDVVEYDPNYLLIRPLNMYLRAKKHTEWSQPSKVNRPNNNY